MNRILIIGAGRSSQALIRYILDHAEQYKWNVIVADSNLEQAKARVAGHPRARATWLDVMKTNDKRDLISRADMVISLLPAHLHLEVSHDCIKLNKLLLTSSYVSKEMYRLGDEARDRELFFIGEMAFDPGLEHMAAMYDLDELRAKGAKVIGYKSYTGGLIAPESIDNPWKYKFTWNPRNIVLAGQGTAQYLENGRLHFITYNELFSKTTAVNIPNLEPLEAYANRDALLYKDIYGLGDVPNLFRGTLRYKGFCEAWNGIVQLGLTDGDFPILNSDEMTYHEWIGAYSRDYPGNSVKERTANKLGQALNAPLMEKLEWLDLFRKKKINLANATPALILERLLLNKWELDSKDKDLLVMQHEITYNLNGQKKRRTATLQLKGENREDTAMSKIIGLPIGIFAKYLVESRLHGKGLNIPVQKQFYVPALEEMEQYGIKFDRKDEVIS